MGSPETCPTCYGRVRNRPGNVSTEGTRVQLCDDPWHTTPPTPPAPAHDAGAAERDELRRLLGLARRYAHRLPFDTAREIDAALRGTKGA